MDTIDIEKGPTQEGGDDTPAAENVAMESSNSVNGANIPSLFGLSAVGSGRKSSEERSTVLERLARQLNENQPDVSDSPRRYVNLENSERGFSPHKLGQRILSLYRINLFHAEVVLYKYVLRSEQEGLTCMQLSDVLQRDAHRRREPGMKEWEVFQRNLDRYVHAKDQYFALKAKSLETIPSFGGFVRGVLDAGSSLNALELFVKNLDRHGNGDNSSTFESERDRYWREISRFDLKTQRKRITSAEEKAEQDSYWIKQWKRFILNTYFAVFGGLILIAPMLIMRLYPKLLTTLFTTSLFVFAIAATLAGVMNTAEPKDIVGATAAYASVLVVFIGTGGGISGGGTDKEGKQTLRNGTIGGIVVGSLAGATILLIVAVKILDLIGLNGSTSLNRWWRKKHGNR